MGNIFGKCFWVSPFDLDCPASVETNALDVLLTVDDLFTTNVGTNRRWWPYIFVLKILMSGFCELRVWCNRVAIVRLSQNQESYYAVVRISPGQ